MFITAVCFFHAPSSLCVRTLLLWRPPLLQMQMQPIQFLHSAAEREGQVEPVKRIRYHMWGTEMGAVFKDAALLFPLRTLSLEFCVSAPWHGLDPTEICEWTKTTMVRGSLKDKRSLQSPLSVDNVFNKSIFIINTYLISVTHPLPHISFVFYTFHASIVGRLACLVLCSLLQHHGQFTYQLDRL